MTLGMAVEVAMLIAALGFGAFAQGQLGSSR